MIHKFVANDNKGNVNVLEVTSTGTKLGKVAPPVEDTDVATKKYVDDNAGGGSSLPPVTSADNGKVLGVVDGAWAASEQGKKFIVTLTPTDLDYSGTMDKTVAEITAAYEAGQEIWANVSAQGNNLYIPLKMASTDVTSQYPSFDFCVYDITSNLMILAYTAYSDDGAQQTYSTIVYALTPAS